MKRKLLSCMLCTTMVLSMAACGGEEVSDPTQAPTQAPTEAPADVTEAPADVTEAPADVTEAPETTAADAAARIEFENYVEGEGVSKESSSDEDGSEQLCGLNKSGFSSYEVNLGEGGYDQAAIRYSSDTAGGKVEVRYMAPDGDLLGEVELPGTGGWGNYATVNVDLPALEAFGRNKTLYFVYSGDDYLFNLNWFQLYKVADVTAQIEAESFAAANGVVAEATPDTVGGEGDQNIGGIQNGTWAMYKLNFGEGGMKQMNMRASSGTEGGTVEVRLGAVDGTLVGSLAIPGTGDWANYQDFSAEMPELASVTGAQDVYLVFTGNDYLFNINNFRFLKGALDVSARVEAEDAMELVGLVAEPCGAESTEDAPTSNLGGVTPGTGAGYMLNFGDGGYNKMTVRASSPMEGGWVIVHKGAMDGEEVFRVQIGDNSVYGPDWGNYGDWVFEGDAVKGLEALTGQQVLYFEFQTPEGSSASHCFNINWYEFAK